MKTTADYIDAIRARYDLASDSRAAALLGITRASVSRLRAGEDSFSDQTARRVAELLEIDAGPVLAISHAIRSKDPADRAAWLAIYDRLTGIAPALAALAILATFCFDFPSSSPQNDGVILAVTVFRNENAHTALLICQALAILITHFQHSRRKFLSVS